MSEALAMSPATPVAPAPVGGQLFAVPDGGEEYPPLTDLEQSLLDGTLGPEEMDQLLEELRESGLDRWEDLDGDGVVSYEELMTQLEARYGDGSTEV
ncbi:hypothetical protein [Streptomyces sp. NPDC051569]|uniref:hypothetical protein n=1 Tax=Streptomyces sp. NPDC051569 TaxID=3365661 RepID=UPI0037B9F337